MGAAGILSIRRLHKFSSQFLYNLYIDFFPLICYNNYRKLRKGQIKMYKIDLSLVAQIDKMVSEEAKQDALRIMRRLQTS